MAKGKKGLRSNGVILTAIAVVAIAIAVIFFTLINKMFATETYYVLNQNVPTRTQVTPEMLEPVVTSEGTSPAASIGIDEVQTGSVYTQYPLNAGDILTSSNIGSMQDIATGVPDEWVVTNFSVGADNAVGGRIQRGTYFDIMVINTAGGAYYPFVNVLALDTTVDLANASSADAVDTPEAQAGQTTQYVVGMSPEDAAKLQSLTKEYGGNSMKLVLSPRQNEYNRPQLASYTGIFEYEPGDGVIWPGESPDGELTDYTFRGVERDAFGRPIQRPENCSDGNAKVSGPSCEGNNQSTTDSGTTESGTSGATDSGTTESGDSATDSGTTDSDTSTTNPDTTETEETSPTSEGN